MVKLSNLQDKKAFAFFFYKEQQNWHGQKQLETGKN